MGTSSSYSGSGGKPGNELRQDVGNWLDGLPVEPPAELPPDSQSPEPQPKPLDPNALLNVIQLLRLRTKGGAGGDGPGGGGGGGVETGTGSRSGGGPARSAAGSARVASRAGAAAYAFRTGNAEALEALGLDYAELSQLNTFEVARKIVDFACGPQADSSIEDHEQRFVAVDVAEWVLDESRDGYTPTPDDIARHAIAIIIAEAALAETAEESGRHPRGELAEPAIRDAAEALANRATFSAKGPTEPQLRKAIQSGIETLRKIRRAGGGG